MQGQNSGFFTTRFGRSDPSFNKFATQTEDEDDPYLIPQIGYLSSKEDEMEYSSQNLRQDKEDTLDNSRGPPLLCLFAATNDVYLCSKDRSRWLNLAPMLESS